MILTYKLAISIHFHIFLNWGEGMGRVSSQSSSLSNKCLKAPWPWTCSTLDFGSISCIFLTEMGSSLVSKFVWEFYFFGRLNKAGFILSRGLSWHFKSLRLFSWVDFLRKWWQVWVNLTFLQQNEWTCWVFAYTNQHTCWKNLPKFRLRSKECWTRCPPSCKEFPQGFH